MINKREQHDDSKRTFARQSNRNYEDYQINYTQISDPALSY